MIDSEPYGMYLGPPRAGEREAVDRGSLRLAATSGASRTRPADKKRRCTRVAGFHGFVSELVEITGRAPQCHIVSLGGASIVSGYE